VYLDVKSPHAYLVLAPALQLAVDYEVQVDFKPYLLSFVDMGISLRHDEDGMRHSPSEGADRRARMFYSTAREYAELQGLRIRGPYKLLRSRLANLALLRAGDAGAAAHFLQTVFDAGWPNGWREYDMECAATLKETLRQLEVDVDGWEAFVEPGGEGDQALAQVCATAEASGCVGVPHIEWSVDGKTKGLFGRVSVSRAMLAHACSCEQTAA
jgi:2-hydroxychromene-2-carboxylate isomerase